jgi:hypothetical protein
LKEAVKKETGLSEESKLEIVSDIETIQGQLSKPNPNKSVVQMMWRSIEKVVTVGSLADVVQKAAGYIGQLFP